MSVKIENDGKITVHLRNAETASEIDDEVILDVDHAGHWIRGIEVLGSVGFDLARAVKPFEPRTPSESSRTGVSYDRGASCILLHANDLSRCVRTQICPLHYP